MNTILDGGLAYFLFSFLPCSLLFFLLKKSLILLYFFPLRSQFSSSCSCSIVARYDPDWQDQVAGKLGIVLVW